jgi:DHA1 family tetracycline resistance protein-like MFS transporter
LIGIKNKKKTLAAIFITFGISTLAATILFPVLAHIFLGPEGKYIMKGIPEHYRGIMLGLFLASFPLAQFLTGPLMGDYSDKKGRKGVFLLSVIIEAFGYFLCALSIHLGLLSLLFLGRIITGLAAGNTSVCLATIVDLSESDKQKVRYFGIGSAVIGLMFVLGPLMGGQLSSIFKDPVLTLAMPMWIGAACAIFNIFVLIFFFTETKTTFCEHPFDVFGSIHNIQQAFRIGQVRDLYLMYFFFLFGWNMIYQFLPAFLVGNFHMDILTVGIFGAAFGCIWIVGTLIMQKISSHVKNMQKLVFFSLVCISIAVIVAAFATQIYSFSIGIGLVVLFSGGIWPIFTAAISKSAEQSMQGKILALSQSIQSFSMMLAPLIGGFFLHKHGAMPFVLTAISSLFAAGVLLRSSKRVFMFSEK